MSGLEPVTHYEVFLFYDTCLKIYSNAPNFELERELLGFGDGLKVLSPNSLVRAFRKKQSRYMKHIMNHHQLCIDKF